MPELVDAVTISERRSPLRRLLDIAFALALLIYTTQMEIPFFATTLENGDRKDNVIPMNTLLYIATGIVVLTRWRAVLTTIFKMPSMLALLAWAFLSATWTNHPNDTIHLAISLSLTTLSGIYLAVAFPAKQQVMILRIVTGVVIAVSLAKIGLGSSAFIHHAFRGAFTSKNEMGRMEVLGILAALIGPANWMKQPLRWMAVAGLCGLLLITKSATALAIGCILVGLFPALRLARIRGPLLLPAVLAIFSVIVGGAILVVNNTEAIFAVLDRDTTMTGRTQLWAAVIHSISKRPWLGYGLGGFWQKLSGPSLEVLQVIRWNAPHAHNGFLELTLNLGLIGLGIFGISFLSSLFRALRHYRFSTDPYLVWPLAFMSYMFLYNLTETTIVRVASIFWILYVAAVASVARHEALEKMPPQHVPADCGEEEIELEEGSLVPVG